MSTAFLSALAYFVTFGGNWLFGQSMIERPLIVGTITGLFLGDIQQGIIIGAALEAVFMGAVNIGGQVSAEPAAATVFATAFTITTASITPEAALAISVPIGVLAGILTMFVNNVILSFLVPFMDRMAENDNGKGIIWLHFGAWFFRFFVFSLVVFFGVLLGQNSIETFVNSIPDKVMNGLIAMAGLLPAVGFAILLKMLWSKELVVYYILGFILVAYFELPLIAVAVLGIILIVIIVNRDKQLIELEKFKNRNSEGTFDELEDFVS